MNRADSSRSPRAGHGGSEGAGRHGRAWRVKQPKRQEFGPVPTVSPGGDVQWALDIGSGRLPVGEGGWRTKGDMARYTFVNLDLYGRATLRWDFNRVPYPFRDGSFDAVFARHTLEHVQLGRIVDVMKEIHRITKPGGLVYIRVPYWNSKAFAMDPTHQTRFTEDTFYYFTGQMRTDHYIPKLFDIVSIDHRFHDKLWWIPRFAKYRLMNLLSEVCTELWVVLRNVKETPHGKAAGALERRAGS